MVALLECLQVFHNCENMIFFNYILEPRHLSLPSWTNSQFSRSVPALGYYSLQQVSLEFNCKICSFYESFTFSICFSKLFILLVSQSLVEILSCCLLDISFWVVIFCCHSIYIYKLHVIYFCFLAILMINLLSFYNQVIDPIRFPIRS